MNPNPPRKRRLKAMDGELLGVRILIVRFSDDSRQVTRQPMRDCEIEWNDIFLHPVWTAAQRCALPAGGREETKPFCRNRLQATQTAWKRADSHPSGARCVSLLFELEQTVAHCFLCRLYVLSNEPWPLVGVVKAIGDWHYIWKASFSIVV